MPHANMRHANSLCWISERILAAFVSAEGEGKGSKPAANNSMVNAVALYDKSGTLIYMGQSKGTITVLDAASLKFLDFVKVCQSQVHQLMEPCQCCSGCCVVTSHS